MHITCWQFLNSYNIILSALKATKLPRYLSKYQFALYRVPFLIKVLLEHLPEVTE
jgi:hypothetical protein